ncbi:G-protein coupled receptor Mth2-like [Contarinia nasturtii]|uniref:G-protein coupled receptor Mth2-like n=1 Tax=Contarinia nasturtii TaxID=265458 RepID=UPI0012D475EE|nr:G-protein coupled receptor Mth2-like [Contarinia nasturtii]
MNFGWISLPFRAIIITFIIVNEANSIVCSKLPCYFFDSINITDGIHKSDRSILFDGINFPYDQYAVLNYIIDNGERKKAESHFRGCLCNIKECFRLCCLDKLMEETTINLDYNCNEELTEMEGEVVGDKQKFVNLYLGEQPTNVKNRTCKQFYIEEEIKLQIANAGKILPQNKTTIRGYCQNRMNDETDENDLNVSICIDWVENITENNDTKVFLDYIEHISMILSVPFLITTFLVYLCLPDLHKNLHGKCFLCYLICQAVCFILEILSFNKTLDSYWEPLMIYLFLCAFQWLNVTAFDAWWNLRDFRNINKIDKSTERRRFIWYMLYGIISPFLLNIFQLFSDILKSVNVDPDKVDELEVAGFICTTFTINVIFFILTACQICRVKQEMYKLTSHEDSFRHQAKFNTAKGNFRMYLRLFIVMGMTYSISGISYLIWRSSIFSEWTEIILSLQGVWIFILFVLKRRVFHLIKQRWEGWNGIPAKKGSRNDSGNESNSRLRSQTPI